MIKADKIWLVKPPFKILITFYRCCKSDSKDISASALNISVQDAVFIADVL